MVNEKSRIELDIEKLKNSILVASQDLLNMQEMLKVLEGIYVEKYKNRDFPDEKEIYGIQEEGEENAE